MRSVAFRVGRWLRRNVPATALAAVLIGAVLTPALTLAAGARRTGSLTARYAAAHPSEYDVDFTQFWGTPLTPQIEALPGVERVTSASFMFGALIPADAGPDAEPIDSLTFVGDSGFWDGPLVAGRRPDPAVPGEFAASADWAALGPYEVGDHFRLVTISAESASTGGFENEPDGPEVDATLVGIWRDLPAEALNDPEFTAITVFPPSLLAAGSIGLAATVGRIATTPGSGIDELRAELDALDGGAQVSVQAHEIVPAAVDDAIHVRTIGFIVLAAVVSLATLAVLTLLLVRQFRVDEADRGALTALGYTHRQIALEPVGRAVPAVVIGAAAAAFAAWALSGLFPYGFGATLEPDAGRHLDVVAHVVGAGLSVVLALGLLALLAHRRVARKRPQLLLDRVARKAPTLASATATRLAFGRSRRAGSTNGALLSVAAVLGVTIAALLVGSSLHALLHSPERWGERWDLGVGQGGEELPSGFAERLAGSDLVAAVTLYGTTEVQTGSTSVPVVAFDAVKGTELPELLDGRLPAAAGEIAISTPAARRFGLGIGDRLTVEGGTGPVELSVVGVTVVPGVEGVEAGDPSVLVNLAGYHELDPGAGLSAAGVFLADDAPADAPQLLASELGVNDGGFGQFSLPPRVIHLRLVEDVPGLVAEVVGALAAISVVHLLVTAVRRRSGERDVLRALGATPGWLRRVVTWQVVMLVVVAIAVGTTVGLPIGRVAFGPFPEQLGASPGIRLPWVPLGVTTAALVSGAIVIGVLVGRRRGTQAVSLQRE